MTAFHKIFFPFIVFILISSCTPPTKLTYISFGEEKVIIESTVVVQYETRLEIKSKFKELGVIIVEGMNEPNIDDIGLLASEKGADGILKEGKNYILIKIMDENSRNLKNAIEQN
ncbi:hypothetical protein ACFL5D_02215 [Candidatus Neomarinimicrobiota bacterium]